MFSQITRTLDQPVLDVDALKTDIQTLELLEKAGKAGERPTATIVSDAVWITTAIAAAIVIGLSFRVPSTSLQLEAATTHVELVLERLIYSAQMDFTDASISMSEKAGNTAAFLAPFKTVSLTDLKSTGVLHIQLERAGQCTSIKVTDGQLSGHVQSKTPELGEFFVLSKEAPELRICAATAPRVRWVAMPISIRAGETVEYGAQNAIEVPSISKGRVTLGGVPYELGTESVVDVHFSDANARVQIRLGGPDGDIGLVAKGQADAINWDFIDITTNRKPNLLEYFGQNSKWLVIYTAVTGSFGLAWSIRKLFRG